jgi:PPK2 family polyphosphate:nucleotide phosphotransferase
MEGIECMDYENFMVKPGKKIVLKKIDPGQTNGYSNRRIAENDLQKYLRKLLDLQYFLFADKKHAVLIILQGIDAAGKDGVCRHVITAMNPQGTKVWSFDKPCEEELRHDYLWRVNQKLPDYGEIAVFNRSHYEDVLVVRVKNLVPKEVWKKRYTQINNFERYLYENNIHILKIFLHISKEEQEKRLLARLLEPQKNWKFNIDDLVERGNWDEYMNAYEDMLNKTSTPYAPWYVIPADIKWFRNITVARIIVDMLENLKLKWPSPSPDIDKYIEIAKKTGKLPQINK